MLHGREFWLLIQRLGDGQARVHIDIHTDDLAAEVLRLEKLGAERVQQAHSWQVRRDPAGLLFLCDPGTTRNAQRQQLTTVCTRHGGTDRGKPPAIAPNHPVRPLRERAGDARASVAPL